MAGRTDESLRLVDFTVGGRPFGVLDLEDGQFFSKVRGTLQVRPGQSTVSYARQPGRYGGQRAVGSREENAELAWTCAVMGSTEDEALRKAGDLLSALAEMSYGRMVEFRPRGATYPTFLEIRGPGAATPNYDADLLEQQGAFLVDLAVPVEPLGRMHRMDILDDYAVDSLADYTAVQGTGANVAVDGGRLHVTTGLTSVYMLTHTARGHLAADRLQLVELARGVAGAAGSNVRCGGVLKYIDASNFLYWYCFDDGTSPQLRLRKVVGGSDTSLGAPAMTYPALGTSFWVRPRIEGNVVWVDYFNQTAMPTPAATPTTSIGPVTLSGADATALGAGVVGRAGPYLQPQHVNTEVRTYLDRPFTYVGHTLPERIALGGLVPGDAPALVDVAITPNGGAAAPVWALISWATRATAPLAGAVAPFGIIEAETGTSLSGWASTADPNYRGGNGLKVTAAGAGTAAAEFVIDPATLAPDPFTLAELDIEVWARVELAAALVSPKLTLSAKPDAGTSFGAERYSSPLGSVGRLLVKPSSGSAFRLTRLGVVTVLCDADRPVKWRIRTAASWATGSTGNFGLDQLFAIPAGQRAASPTGRANDSSFPKFVASTSETTKVVRADLSGAVAQPGANPFPDSGLGGEPIEFPAGDVDALVALSSVVPDDPTSDTSSGQIGHIATVHFDVWPRVRLLRGG